jgi:hypothetical protein
VPKYSKKEQEFKELIESAYSGDAERLAQIIQAVGFIHPDNGLKQNSFEGVTSRQTLKRWEKEGLETIKKGRSVYYPIKPFIKFILDKTIKSRNMESDAVKDWKASDAEFVAKRRKLEYEKELGNYVPVGDVKQTWSEHIGAVRKRLLAIPRAMASQLQGETKRSVIEKELRTEINSALEELSG